MGLGKMGLLHAGILNSLPGSRVVAIAETSSFARDTFAQLESEIHLFPDIDSMLDSSRLDAVVIATPVVDHTPAAIKCTERELPFLVEKPLAVSVAQANPLMRLLREKEFPHMIGFMTRYVDSFSKGKQLLESGCLGRILRITATIYVSQLFRPGSGWRYKKETSGGGVLPNQGAHLIDLLTWYFGGVSSVNARMSMAYSTEVEDFAHLFLEFDSGLSGWLDCSWSVRFRRTVETSIDILGDNGSLMLTDDAVRLYLDEAAGGLRSGLSTFNASDLYRSVPIDVGEPQYTREDIEFLDAVRTNRLPEANIFQAFHVQSVVDAAYASAEGAGQSVNVNGQ